MEHIHEAEIQLDGLIRCRICGEVLSYAEKILGKVSSARMATKLLNKIAFEGKFRMDSIDGEFTTYAKDRNGIREELTARKQSNRVYLVLQKLISKI